MMMRFIRNLTFGVAAVLVLAGCAAPPVAPPTPAVAPKDFYDVPPIARSGHRGDIIRMEPVPARTNANRTVYRVMYRTADSSGRTIAATGIVSIPTAPAPAGGWPVLSYAHGTTGMAPACAPSRAPSMPETLGFPGVIVGPDFPGLGPNGQLHAYMSGLSEGRSIVDMVRAARNIDPVRVGRRWISSGASQGGHAALFGGQVAGEAPELDLIGVIAFAPSSEMTTAFPKDDPELSGAIAAMVLYGRAVDHPKLDPAKYATPEVAAWSKRLYSQCLAETTEAFKAIPKGKAWLVDPRTTEPARSIWLANDPGRKPTREPILIVQGESDDVVTPERTRALIARECALGETVEALHPANTTHYTVIVNTKVEVTAWIKARLAGEAVGKKACGAAP